MQQVVNGVSLGTMNRPGFSGVLGLPRIRGGEWLETGAVPDHGAPKGRRGYPPEFRRRVLDLVEAGRPIAQIASDLSISQQTSYVWRKQDRIDPGLEPGTTSTEAAELAEAVDAKNPIVGSCGDSVLVNEADLPLRRRSCRSGRSTSTTTSPCARSHRISPAP
jgi:transposase-like protein